MSDDRLRALRDHLVATEELPVDPAASRWLGEATAVATDVADAETMPDAVVTERVERVVELLDEVGGTGHPEADERVTAARDLAADVLTDDG